MYVCVCLCVSVCTHKIELLHLRQIKLHKYLKSEINTTAIAESTHRDSQKAAQLLTLMLLLLLLLLLAMLLSSL